MRCPICNKNIKKAASCPVCGYDDSVNIEKYGSFFPVVGDLSVEEKRKQWELGRWQDTALSPVEKLEQMICAAQKGQPEAQMALYHAYRSGDGLSKNQDRALYWLKKAAEAGETEAQKFLQEIPAPEMEAEILKVARSYYKAGEDDPAYFKKAIACTERLPENPEAVFLQGQCYEAIGGAEDDRATVCYGKAAEMGHARAQLYMGIRFLRWNVPENKEIAMMWLWKAARQGETTAQTLLLSLMEEYTQKLRRKQETPKKAETGTRLKFNGF